MQKEKIITTKSSEETQQFAEDFIKRRLLDQGVSLPNALVITLTGDLGAGKTTFVQGLAKELGIEQRIISPTFIIVRKYSITYKVSSIRNFYHIDLYRVESESALQGLGLEEILHEKDAVVVIEWPERLGKLLPEEKVDIKFEVLTENQRKLTILRLCDKG